MHRSWVMQNRGLLTRVEEDGRSGGQAIEAYIAAHLAATAPLNTLWVNVSARRRSTRAPGQAGEARFCFH